MGKITDLLKPEGEKRIFAMRQPGIEPGSTAWKAAMLTTIPLTLTSAASLLLVDCEDEGLGPQHKKKKNGVERRQREKKKMDKRVKN